MNINVKTVIFSTDVTVLNENGKIEKKVISLESKKKIKTPFTTSRKLKKTYNQQQAQCVAGRIEMEINDMGLYEIRQREEIIVENLLLRYRFYTKINKVYRLSNYALIVLKKKLSLA